MSGWYILALLINLVTLALLIDNARILRQIHKNNRKLE